MIIESKIKNYSFDFIDNLLSKKRELFKDLKGARLFFFVDKNIHILYKKELESFIADDFVLVIEADENNKDYTNIAQYYEVLINNQFTRNDCLVTIGGGILQDISGFIASTLYRGIQWVFIPTTLLAQADSCIGSKTSINFNQSKNLIGTFFPPDRVFIDTTFCHTLTDEYFNSGLGEIIKFHLLSDATGYQRLVEYLSSTDLRSSPLFKSIIESTLQIKISYFSNDEFDTGRRNLLNYGHCFGHSLEAASNFSVCHGEAVIVGMGFANLLSLKRGIIKNERYAEIEEILLKYYPRFDLGKISIDQLIYHLKRDKKRTGKDLTMIMAKDIGDFEKFNDVKESEVRGIYNEFIEYYPSN